MQGWTPWLYHFCWPLHLPRRTPQSACSKHVKQEELWQCIYAAIRGQSLYVKEKKGANNYKKGNVTWWLRAVTLTRREGLSTLPSSPLPETLSSGQRQGKTRWQQSWCQAECWRDRYQSLVQQRKQKPTACKGKHLKCKLLPPAGPWWKLRTRQHEVPVRQREGGRQDRLQVHLTKTESVRNLPHPRQPGTWTLCPQNEMKVYPPESLNQRSPGPRNTERTGG